MNLQAMNSLLAELPAYTTVVAELDSGSSLRENRSYRLMARDLPGADRRFTNLDSGTEMFLPFNENLGLVSVTLYKGGEQELRLAVSL